MSSRLTEEELNEIEQLDKEVLHRLWVAISELFLDTELQDHTFDWMVKELEISNLSKRQLAFILENHVAPVLAPNVLSVAGEWAGFDKDWLVEKIEERGKVGLLDKVSVKLALKVVSPDWMRAMDLLEERSSGDEDVN